MFACFITNLQQFVINIWRVYYKKGITENFEKMCKVLLIIVNYSD